jgi:hypothetical protein
VVAVRYSEAFLGWYDEHETEYPEEEHSSSQGEPCIFNSVTPVSITIGPFVSYTKATI